jgi:NIMA (never in mitosis gene a)-related kinase
MNKPSYKIIKLLGEGSYGKAFLCINRMDNSQCVIKQINIQNMSEKDKQDTLNEAKILEKLDHPNIIKFKEVFIANKPIKTLNIVTEYADGGDLSLEIKNQRKEYFKESQILHYFTQICLAIKHIHGKHIMHRDLKSQNIFLTKTKLVKLGDFGISKNLNCTWEKAKTMIGTPYYLSPELVNNKQYTIKSDIWSLGVLLYEMMALKMPFDANSLPMLTLKIIKGNYAPPPQIYTSDLRTLVSQLLNVDPDKRPTVDKILQLPIIKNRIKNYLNEKDYNKEFSKSIVKLYQKEKKPQINKNFKNEKENEKKEININRAQTNSDSVKKNEQILNFIKNKKNSSIVKSSQSEKNVNQELKNLINEKREHIDKDKKKFNESGVMWPEKQEELQKKNEEKKKLYNPNQLFNEYKDKTQNEDLDLLLSNFDINKMNEDQYNQNRMLNNLNNIYNEDDEDSDNNVEDLNDINSISTNDVENENRLNFEHLKNENENKNENKNEDNNNEDNNNAYESDFQQLEIIRKDLEKDLGEKLLMKVYHYVDDNTDKEVVKIDYDTLREKIKKEFPLKFKFTEKDVEKAIEKIPEVFTIVSKDRLTFI